MAPETKAFAFGVVLGGVIACTALGIVVFGDRIHSMTVSNSDSRKIPALSGGGILTGAVKPDSESGTSKAQDRLAK